MDDLDVEILKDQQLAKSIQDAQQIAETFANLFRSAEVLDHHPTDKCSLIDAERQEIIVGYCYTSQDANTILWLYNSMSTLSLQLKLLADSLANANSKIGILRTNLISERQRNTQIQRQFDSRNALVERMVGCLSILSSQGDDIFLHDQALKLAEELINESRTTGVQ